MLKHIPSVRLPERLRILGEMGHGDEHEPDFTEFGFIERLTFHERAKKAYAAIAAGERVLYADIILKKEGVRDQ